MREALRRSLHDAAFAQAFAGLVLTADEFELAGAHYRIDSPNNTEVQVLSLPYSTTFRPWGQSSTGFHLEGALGYARATEQTPDVYSGSIPGFETSLDTEWSTYAALVGAGLEFDLTSELTFTPILDLGLAYIRNDTDYGGPGTLTTQSLFDGLAFNWEAFAFSHGGAARTEWRHRLTPAHELTVMGRYDLRWVDSFAEDDPAQEFKTRLQALTARADVTGETDLVIGGSPLRWRTTLAYRHFLEGSLVGIPELVQIGATLELDDALPFGSMLSLSGAVILGPNVDGWSIGFGLRF